MPTEGGFVLAYNLHAAATIAENAPYDKTGQQLTPAEGTGRAIRYCGALSIVGPEIGAGLRKKNPAF
jgi:hypothetical protein